MGIKGSWPRGKSSSFCVKNCRNRDVKCDICWKFDCFNDANYDIESAVLNAMESINEKQ
jgi:hypothetical protein